MKEKGFIFTGTLLFTLVSLVHLARLINGWDIVVGGWIVPTWLSGLTVVFLGYLALSGYQLYRKN